MLALQATGGAVRPGGGSRYGLSPGCTPITLNGPRWLSNFKQGQIDAHGIRFNAGIVAEWLAPVEPTDTALAAYLGQKAPRSQRSFEGAMLFDVLKKVDLPGNPDLVLHCVPATEIPRGGAVCAD